ncbi:MAG: diaminopropionate ammonia-lyase [Sedimenticola sp.]|nr:diaminopropionate ammonia-lyase [Sedimenticola sp.]
MADSSVQGDPSVPQHLLKRCPAASPTPLRHAPGLARLFGIESLFLKDESQRMGLGSFKALGAAYVLAQDASARLDTPQAEATAEQMGEALRGSVYTCASAGNHGLSLAAGARAFGADAVIYLSQTVPEAFAERLRSYGAEVVRAGLTYEESMAAAAEAARRNSWTLLSDSSWPGYVSIPGRVMEGYLVMGAEVITELTEPPTHIFLQAGVGGLAAAMTALFRARWGGLPTIVVVEPEAAPAIIESIRAGRAVTTTGPVSTMGRLDCKAPSHIALAELAREADWFVTITDSQCDATAKRISEHGFFTTPSGAAGVSALHHAASHPNDLGLTGTSRVLAFITEGTETLSRLMPS